MRHIVRLYGVCKRATTTMDYATGVALMKRFRKSFAARFVLTPSSCAHMWLMLLVHQHLQPICNSFTAANTPHPLLLGAQFVKMSVQFH